MKIGIASDHAGYQLKEYLKVSLPNIQWVDFGPASEARVDYPDFASALCQAIETTPKLASTSKPRVGILVCGSGIGMAIAANKFPGVRAAHVESETTAKLAKQHNDANILCLGQRITPPNIAKGIVNAWLESKFEGGRHELRLQKIHKLELK